MLGEPMKTRLLFAMCAFLGSYLPLGLILLAQDYDPKFLNNPMCFAFWTDSFALPFRHPFLAIGTPFCCAVCFALTVVGLAVIKPKNVIVITEAKHIPSELTSYSLPYIISLIGVDYQSKEKLFGLIVFLGTMFWISYKSGRVILNPLFIIAGWRLYELSFHYAASSDIQTKYAFVNGNVEVNQRHKQAHVHDVLIIKPGDGC